MRIGLLTALLTLAALALTLEPQNAAARSKDPSAEAFRTALRQLEHDRHGARAFVFLAKLHGLENQVTDLGHLAAAYRRVANDRRALPDVSAYARFLLAGIERRGGDLESSSATLRRLGFIDGWKIIGPFDNEGKLGFGAIYPPEESQDLDARYPGKIRQVGWRPLPAEARSQGFVNLGAAVRPAREVAIYALALVDSPREQRAHIRIGSSGATKLFVNGMLVLADPSYHPARLDQAAVAVTLRKGSNRILLKLCHDEGPFGFYARLTEPSGAPLKVGVASNQSSSAGTPPRPERVAGALEMLDTRARAARGSKEIDAGMDLAVALAERRNFDERERRASAEARRAASLAPDRTAAQLLAAALEEEDANRRRAFIDKAAANAPNDPEVLTALGMEELRRDRAPQAALMLQRAARIAPSFVDARITLAQAHDQAGLDIRAMKDLLDLGRSYPNMPAAVTGAAHAYRRLGQIDDAERMLLRAITLRYDDGDSRSALVAILIDRGDIDRAAHLLDESLRLDPSQIGERLRKADLLGSNGRLSEAEAVYAQVERICPEEAETYERRGNMRLRAGRREGATADFQRALELKPQNPQLKELVRSITPERGRFEKPYLLDAKELARAAPAPLAGEDAIVLGELKVTRVFPSGLSATFNQLIVKVLSQRGADAYRTKGIGYAPDRQDLRIERGRIFKPNGERIETYQDDERSTSEPWYRLYYDTRSRILTFPDLAPGDLLEVAYRVEDIASENLLSDYFGDITFLQDTTRTALFDYVLLMPAGRKIFSNRPEMSGLTHSEKALADGTSEQRWTARDVPLIQPEPGMPGWSEVSPFVHVSTYADWEHVATFYWGLVREQLKPNDEVRATAARIAAEVRARPARDEPEDLRIIKGVYHFVVTNIRYVGLEFGIHGYKPYRVDQILSRRFGDCKDKASLAHALLESLGIDSRLVLLRMKRLGRVPESPASLAIFNHAILYVPKYDLWLDGTASYSGSRDLPGEDRGATVLVVNPGQAPRFGMIPEAKAEENRTMSRFVVRLTDDAGAAIQGESRVFGLAAPAYRQSYQAEADRRAAFEQSFSRTFPGLTVNDISLSDLSRLEDDVSMQFTLEVPRYAQKIGTALSFTPFAGGHTYTESYAPLSSRRLELVLGEPFDNVFTYRYDLPAGASVEALPEPVAVDSPFGAFDVRYKKDGASFLAEAHVKLTVERVEASEYSAFRDFVIKLDRALARKVRVVRRSANR